MRQGSRPALAGLSGEALLAAVDDWLDDLEDADYPHADHLDGAADVPLTAVAGQTSDPSWDDEPAWAPPPDLWAVPHHEDVSPSPRERPGPDIPDPVELERLVDDIEASLPRLIPDGYERDGRGTWRYPDGAKVPGARDLTLGRLWEPRTSRDFAEIPSEWLSHPDFEWAHRFTDGVAGEFVFIPRHVWEPVSRLCVGIDAPELLVTRVLTATELVSATGGLAPSTIRTHLSRGTGPRPAGRFGTLTVFSHHVVRAWLAARPRPGRPAKHRSTTRSYAS